MNGGGCEDVLARLAQSGIDIFALAAQFQSEGVESLVKAWNELMAVITSKVTALGKDR